ncbi:ankyrin repeat-containing domain protein [Aspergillus floccosus]
MSILSLPNELLLLIAAQLECRDLYALLRTHPSLYRQLISYLYLWNLESRGFTALIGAAKRGSISTLQRFLDIGVDLGWKSRCQAYMSSKVPAAKRRRATSMADTKPQHPICHAATNGRAEFVRMLIEHGADINFKDIHGRSPLALAARQGHLALVQMLVSLGANLLSYDRSFHRPAANAASQGHHIVADYLLLEMGKYSPVKLNRTIMIDIQWMLLYAAKEGNEKRMSTFLAKGADVNFQLKGERCTPLCGALLSAPQPLKTIKFLLDRGADPNIALPMKNSRSGGWKLPPSPPLSLAMIREESLPLLKILLKYGADATQCGIALFGAIRLEKEGEFRLLVDHHADLYVTLKRRSLAEDMGRSYCESIRDACLGLDLTAPTRELGYHRTVRCRRVHRRYPISNATTTLTVRTPASVR